MDASGITPAGVNINADGNMSARDIAGRDINIQHIYQHAQAVSPVEEDEAPAPGEPPFKGLQYFDEADAELFFGREALTEKLVGRLRESRFIAVVGASGSGKSSLAGRLNH
jgi:hypothetical protein